MTNSPPIPTLWRNRGPKTTKILGASENDGKCHGNHGTHRKDKDNDKYMDKAKTKKTQRQECRECRTMLALTFFRLARVDNGNASNIVWAWAAARGAFRANALKHHRASFNHYWSIPKLKKSVFLLEIFRCASIFWIHVGESVTQWLMLLTRLIVKVGRQDFCPDHCQNYCQDCLSF